MCLLISYQHGIVGRLIFRDLAPPHSESIGSLEFNTVTQCADIVEAKNKELLKLAIYDMFKK